MIEAKEQDVRGVAIVTGAGGGIGSAIASALQKCGIAVALLDVDKQKVDAVRDAVEKVGGHALSVAADVSDYSACVSAVENVASTLGPPTILVNNVGISPKTNGRALSVWEMPPEEWDRVIEVNLNSAFYMTRLVTPHMVDGRQGRVVNISSVAGEVYCDIVASHYAATKAALIGLTRHWAAELGPYGVTVNAVAPGRIETPLLATVSASVNSAVISATPMARLGKPAEVADAVTFFVSEQACFVTGQVLDVAGGWLMS